MPADIAFHHRRQRARERLLELPPGAPVLLQQEQRAGEPKARADFRGVDYRQALEGPRGDAESRLISNSA
ncbi:MAG: hypothetical protein F4X35_04035 [Alphaproteobacteria bacterium]|nr:hypothetical protein [Alphaproteobacteria bacterium]